MDTTSWILNLCSRRNVHRVCLEDLPLYISDREQYPRQGELSILFLLLEVLYFFSQCDTKVC